MIYIARNQDDLIIGVVAAESEKLAAAYWHGVGIGYNSIEDAGKYEQQLCDVPSGVIPILKTVRARVDSLKQDAFILLVR